MNVDFDDAVRWTIGHFAMGDTRFIFRLGACPILLHFVVFSVRLLIDNTAFSLISDCGSKFFTHYKKLSNKTV